jgi:hypothetical protein
VRDIKKSRLRSVAFLAMRCVGTNSTGVELRLFYLLLDDLSNYALRTPFAHCAIRAGITLVLLHCSQQRPSETGSAL